MNYNDLTDLQKDAVNVSANVLVSAAAGSGKTGVLVERIIKKLTDETNPVFADKLLVVTFTNAAAAEMRLRIEKRLDEMQKEMPKSRLIAKQKLLLQSAKICTIDAFCLDFLRENFEICEVTPNFKIADETTIKKISEETLSEIFNNKFEEHNEDFFELLDFYNSIYDDKNLKALVNTVYEKSQNFPMPEIWLDSIADKYTDSAISYWKDKALSYANSLLDVSENINNYCIKVIKENPQLDKYSNTISEYESIILSLRNYIQNNNWDGLFNKLNTGISFPRLGTVSGDVPHKEEIKNLRDIVKKNIENVRDIICFDDETIHQQFIYLKKPIQTINGLVKEYARLFKINCLKENLLTFNLIEHIAFESLCEFSDNKFIIKEIFKDFTDNFEEVLVDEYQDVNDLQDYFFSAISNNSEKLFCVGDVKQSIYGFRSSNPENFKKKCQVPLYTLVKEDILPKKLLLNANFRSRKNICEFINYIFSNSMSEQSAGMEYTQDEFLLPNATFPNTDETAVNVEVIDLSENEDKWQVAEAKRIAGYISKLKDSGKIIKTKNNTLRPLKYSDVTILMRSVNTNGPKLAEELMKCGIPVSFAKSDFFNTVEITTIISLLKVINNPTDDISLVSLLTSPLFCYTMDDIAKIRVESKRGNIYSAVIKYAKNDKKTAEFLQNIEKYRRYASLYSLSQLILHLFEDTKIINIMMYGKEVMQSKTNLINFLSMASDFESTDNGSLTSFLKYIMLLKDNSQEKPKNASTDDCITITTIHGSKGLQYPVCILADCSHGFNNKTSKDFTNSLVLNNNCYGIKFIDPDFETETVNLPYNIIKKEIDQINREEEFRLLYVALTRAEDRLCIILTKKNLGKYLNNTENIIYVYKENAIKYISNNANSYTDIILPLLLIHKNGITLQKYCAEAPMVFENTCNFELNTNDYTDTDYNPESTTESNSDSFNRDKLTEIIKNNIKFVYKYEGLKNAEMKTSVSELVHNNSEYDLSFNEKPAFMSENGLSATDMGTCVHKVMQFLDFSTTKDNLEAELERMYESEIITQQEYECIDRNIIIAFLQSDVCAKILSAETVKREMRFINELPLKSVYENIDETFADEKIIIQGAVDCVFSDGKELTVLDFKTDRVDDENTLINNYKKQLDIYSVACSSIFNLPVKNKIIYSFALGKEIKV